MSRVVSNATGSQTLQTSAVLSGIYCNSYHLLIVECGSQIFIVDDLLKDVEFMSCNAALLILRDPSRVPSTF